MKNVLGLTMIGLFLIGAFWVTFDKRVSALEEPESVVLANCIQSASRHGPYNLGDGEVYAGNNNCFSYVELKHNITYGDNPGVNDVAYISILKGTDTGSGGECDSHDVDEEIFSGNYLGANVVTPNLALAQHWNVGFYLEPNECFSVWKNEGPSASVSDVQATITEMPF